MEKSFNITLHINSLEKKLHIIISTDSKKASDKIYHPFIMKTLNKLSHYDKGLYKHTHTHTKTIAKIIIDGDTLLSS